jgi:hypothetical protein
MRRPLIKSLIGLSFKPHAERANALRRLDKRAPDVMIADNRLAKIDARLSRVTDRRRDARIRNGNDERVIGGFSTGCSTASRLPILCRD